MKKITLATLKAFIRKNGISKLYFRGKSRFDGMTDSVESCDTGFIPAKPTDLKNAHINTLGIMGVWIVGGGRDYIGTFTEDDFEGLKVSNCCGSFILAINRTE